MSAEARHYVLNGDEQAELLRRLVIVAVDDGNWTERFVDPATEEAWTSYYPRAEQHGGGPRVLRRDAPTLDGLSLRLRACLTSGRLDDAVGLGMDLSNDPESWDAALSHLERERPTPSAHVQAFLGALGVRHPVNRRSVLNKTLEELNRDAAYVQALAARARRLMDDV